MTSFSKKAGGADRVSRSAPLGVPTRRLALSHPDEGDYQNDDNRNANPGQYITHRQATSLPGIPYITSYHDGASQACCSSPTRRPPLATFAYVTPNDRVLARAAYATGQNYAGRRRRRVRRVTTRRRIDNRGGAVYSHESHRSGGATARRENRARWRGYQR